MQVTLTFRVMYMVLITIMTSVTLQIMTSTNFRSILQNGMGNQYSQRGKMVIPSVGSWAAVWAHTTVLGLLIQKMMIII